MERERGGGGKMQYPDTDFWQMIPEKNNRHLKHDKIKYCRCNF